MSRRPQSLQSADAPAQVAHRLRDGLGLPDDLLSTVEAAQRLKYVGASGVANFMKWANRHRVPRLHRGRICLWEPSVLLAFLRREPWTRDRHAQTVAPFAASRPRKSVALRKTLDGGSR